MRISKINQEKFGGKEAKKEAIIRERQRLFIIYCFVSKRPIINFIETVI